MTQSRSSKRWEFHIPLDQSRKFDDVLRFILDQEQAPSEPIPRLIAMISPHSGSGTTFLCRSLASRVNRAAAQREIAKMARAGAANSMRMNGYRDGLPFLATIDDLLSETAFVPDPSRMAITIDYREVSRPGAQLARVLADSLEVDTLQGVVRDGRTVRTVLDELPVEWDSGALDRKECLLALASCFRLVLVDMPSLEESLDIRAVAPLVSGVIVVVEAGRTTAQKLRRLIDTIEQTGGTMLGYVLNKRSHQIPDWLYRLLEKAGVS
jgi:hypothetical protein